MVKRVLADGVTMCSLCSRLRRGVLYRVAGELGATKIALGHHRDDILATFFLNLFFGGKLKTMPPKLVSDDGAHVVIRPLAYVRERDLARYADLMAFPIIPCNLCGSQEHLQRKQVGAMLRDWEKKFPGRIESIYNALAKVVPSHLMDRSLFDFAAVRATGRAEPDGDIAFDVDAALERAAGAPPASPQPASSPAFAAAGESPASDRGSPAVSPSPPRRSRWAQSPSPEPAAVAAPVPVASRRAAAGRPPARRLHPVFPPHLDRFRTERRADDRLRRLRGAAQPDRRRAAPRRGRSAQHCASSPSRSIACWRVRSAERWKPRS